VAKFRILGQRRTEKKPLAETSTFILVVVPIEGEVEPGLEFTAFDTHHPFKVVVRLVQKEEANLLLSCETKWPVYEGFFERVIIDSSGTVKGKNFFYDHDAKYGPNEL
jgi:hypothetical protein